MSISVSSAYRAMMQGREVSSRMQVQILLGNSVFNLDNNDIVKGSWNLNWRSSNNGSFSLGTCYAAELTFSSFVSVEPEIDGQYVTIKPTVFYKVGNNEVAFPLGEFTCDSPKVYSKTTFYECYDRMIAFDKKITSRFTGTPYNLIDYICTECGVENGNTSQQISQMINSTQNIVIDPTRVLTFRDALSYISIILGGYCIIDRSGKLSVRKFQTSPSMELPRHRRKTTTFGGYKTCFAGVECRFLAEQNFYPYSSIDPDSDGIILDLGDIPVIEDSETAKNRILSNIHSVLDSIEYYPCDIEMVGDPSIEAGDMITTKDRYGIDRNIILTSVTYGWRSSANILSEGTNPKLENVSSVEKRNKASQDAYAKAANIVTATFVNGMTYTLDDDEMQEITSLRFSTNKDLTAVFGAEIPLYSDRDGYVEIAYIDAGEVGDVVKARVHEGYNLVTLVNHLHYDPNRVVLLQLKARTEALASGGTAPEVTIETDTIRSYIFAQGLEADLWDGIITISENIGYVEAQMAMYGITDGISVEIQNPVAPSFLESVSSMSAEMQTYSISDTITIDLETGEEYLRCGAGHRAGNGRMFAPLII